MARRKTTAALTVLAAVGMTIAVPSVAQAGCVSDRGYYYSITSHQGLRLNGFGNPKIMQNTSGSTATMSLSQSSTGTSEWSVNGSLSAKTGFNFLAIKGEVTATVGGSYTQSNAQTQTVTATISVPNNRYGILQGGVFRKPSAGQYGYDNGNCVYSQVQNITTKLPVEADGFAATTNTTGNVPWDQGNVG